MADRASSKFFQAAWIVDDLEKSIKRWVRTAGVGPFFIIPHVKVDNLTYRGAPATLDFSGALAQSGPLQIELIQQHNDGPSAYRDVFPKGHEGFHHLCTMTTDFDTELAHYRSEDCAIAMQGAFGDMRYMYVDTRATLGHMTEVIEDRVSIKEIFKIVADASLGWDGSNPIRSF